MLKFLFLAAVMSLTVTAKAADKLSFDTLDMVYTNSSQVSYTEAVGNYSGWCFAPALGGKQALASAMIVKSDKVLVVVSFYDSTAVFDNLDEQGWNDLFDRSLSAAPAVTSQLPLVATWGGFKTHVQSTQGGYVVKMGSNANASAYCLFDKKF